MMNEKIRQFKDSASRHVWRFYKRVYQSLLKNNESQQVLFIVGCQRSGTTMLSRLLDRDLRSHSFDEQSKLSTHDPQRLVWDSLEDVKWKLLGGNAPLVVAKPLVESHRIGELLDTVPNSRAVWMYRNPLDVVSSNLKRFGKDNGVSDIHPILENISDWRSAGCTENTRNVIRRLYHPDSINSLADAAALFWLSRNHLFFNQNLQADNRVIAVRYERFVKDPERGINGIYQFLNLESPSITISAKVSNSSVGKGSSIQISTPIKELCLQQLADLDAVAITQNLDF